MTKQELLDLVWPDIDTVPIALLRDGVTSAYRVDADSVLMPGQLQG